MPLLITYHADKSEPPARIVRPGEDVDALIEAALRLGAVRVRVVQRSDGRELRVVEAEPGRDE